MQHTSRTLRSAAGCLVVGLAALLSGCRSTAVPRNSSDASVATTISVENQDFSDMTVYVLVNTQRTRLGIAPGNKTTVFELPKYLVVGAPQLRFLCDPIGGNRAPVSEEVTVFPGDQLVMIINPGG
jgi:hypothetical protein